MSNKKPIVILESKRFYDFKKGRTIHTVMYVDKYLNEEVKEIRLKDAKKIYIPHFCFINDGEIDLYPDYETRGLAKNIFSKWFYLKNLK